MTSTQKTYSTNPNTVKTRMLLALNQEYQKKVSSKVNEYLKNKKINNPEFAQSERERLRVFSKNNYQNDPEAREKKKAAALARYYSLKAEKAAATTATLE